MILSSTGLICRHCVNFINILRTNFLYKCRFSSFYNLHVTRKKAAKMTFVRKICAINTDENDTVRPFIFLGRPSSSIWFVGAEHKTHFPQTEGFSTFSDLCKLKKMRSVDIYGSSCLFGVVIWYFTCIRSHCISSNNLKYFRYYFKFVIISSSVCNHDIDCYNRGYYNNGTNIFLRSSFWRKVN